MLVAGPSVVPGQLTTPSPGSGSLTATLSSVTLPSLATRNEYWIASLATVTVDGATDLRIEIEGVRTALTVAESDALTAGPIGGSP